ncbi:exonuclease domain-containing protein, partial [Turicimonas muris]
MQNFAAIDFETANMYRTSVCSVGLVIVRDGIIADKFYSLIRPTPHFYTSFNTKIHGICKEDTLNAPLFPDVWMQAAPLVEGLTLVAHNSPFDEGCLKAVFAHYEMPYPE